MRLRTQLVLAFVLLSVVPLAGLTLFSYFTSLRAFRRAVKAEGTVLAEEMGGRIGAFTADLDRRIERLGDLPLASLARGGDAQGAERAGLLEHLRAEMGDAARFVESLEFVPAPPASPAPPAATARPGQRPRAAASPRRPAPAVPPSPPSSVVVLEPEPPSPPIPGMPGRRPRWVLRHRLHAGEAEATPIPPEGSTPPEAETAPEAEKPPGAGSLDNEEKQKAFEEALSRRMEALGRDIGRRAEALARDAESRRGISEEQRRRIEADARQAARDSTKAAQDALQARNKQLALLGRGFDHLIRRGGAAVGTVRAQVRAEDVLETVLARTARRRGEIPFALDGEGKLYASNPDEESQLKSLSLSPAAEGEPHARSIGDWIVVMRRDPASGLTLGIARPVGESLKEIRATAARNLGYGLGIVALALLGILPLSARMTRNLASLSDGAERLARGDLEARVPVRSRDEFGRLAETFNKMAQDLRLHQERLLERERLRKELEMSRRIQEELLPRDPLRFWFAEAKGISIPAREVGGDFFNYFPLAGGEAALLVGDVSGKGLPAALLMANLQATLRARLPLEKDLAVLATHLDSELAESTPEASYLTLFMGVLDGRERVLRYVSAGHNTQFALRADGAVVPLESTGRPLGLLPGAGYEEGRVALAEGDGLFLFTDGLVDAENEAGEAFGMERLETLLCQERMSGLDGILAHVEQAVRAHRGSAEPLDDATMLVLKVGRPVA